MAKHNPGDLLTSDWNPVVGCQRYSAGCRDCWWLDGIMPWQIRLGNLPESVTEGEPTELDARFDPAKLRPKKGIVGVVQHGDLFWDKIPDATIHRVLDVVDQVAREREAKNFCRAKFGRAPTTPNTSSGRSALSAWRTFSNSAIRKVFHLTSLVASQSKTKRWPMSAFLIYFEFKAIAS